MATLSVPASLEQLANVNSFIHETIPSSYRPLIPQEEYKRTFMGSVVNNYFENSYKEMVSFFAKEQKISTDELKEIIDMIEKGRE